jgi:undecaprenyl-diphosphatase
MGLLERVWNAVKPKADRLWLFGWERAAFNWIDARRNRLLDAVLIPASLLTEWGLLWAMLLLREYSAGDARQKRLALRIAEAMLFISVAAILPCLYLLPRKRPYLALPDVAPLSLPLTSPCFPSGHAMSAAFVAVALAPRYPKQRLPLALLALAVCYGRIYCGMHWPLDVIVGALLGIGGGTWLSRREDPPGSP